MLEQLHRVCRQLLDEQRVQVVIGFGQSSPDAPAHPIFVTRPDDVDQLVFNGQCYANLATYLTRKEIRALGKPAVIVKGCDHRALLVLQNESQIDRSQIVVIGVACDGVGRPPLPKCRSCEVHLPQNVDFLVGQSDGPAPTDPSYAPLEAFMTRSPAERMAFWQSELARCIKCYACRQACPLCYCERCIVDKNRPTCIDTSATLQGNFAWHIARAFHLAGRCVGCGECSRACPVGIDLMLLNMATARAAEVNFGYRAGMDPDAEPVVGTYRREDKEAFIQ